MNDLNVNENNSPDKNELKSPTPVKCCTPHQEGTLYNTALSQYQLENLFNYCDTTFLPGKSSAVTLSPGKNVNLELDSSKNEIAKSDFKHSSIIVGTSTIKSKRESLASTDLLPQISELGGTESDSVKALYHPPKSFSSPLSSSAANGDLQTRINISVTDSPSPLYGSFYSYGPICRICHEGDEKERFISPCQCSGSLALVHKSCLQKWLASSMEDKCELCHFTFPVLKIPKSFTKFLQENPDTFERNAIKSDIACLCILTPLIFATTYLTIIAALHFQLNDSGDDSFNQSTPYEQPGWSLRNGGIGNKSTETNFSLNPSIIILPRNTLTWSYGQFSGFIILAGALLLVYAAWIFIAIRHHRKEWLQWRSTHYDVILDDTKLLKDEKK